AGRRRPRLAAVGAPKQALVVAALARAGEDRAGCLLVHGEEGDPVAVETELLPTKLVRLRRRRRRLRRRHQNLPILRLPMPSSTPTWSRSWTSRKQGPPRTGARTAMK